MSREFDLLDTIRLWDSMFADLNRNEFMTYLCCAMVLEQRELLFKGDFSDNLRLVRVRWRNGKGSEGRNEVGGLEGYVPSLLFIIIYIQCIDSYHAHISIYVLVAVLSSHGCQYTSKTSISTS